MCLSSAEILDINLTYGCILSIQETLDFIKKDEADAVSLLRSKEASPFDGLLEMRNTNTMERQKQDGYEESQSNSSKY